MDYEVVAKTRTGWNRPVGVYGSQEQADKAAEEFAIGEGCDTMVRPAKHKAVTS